MEDELELANFLKLVENMQKNTTIKADNLEYGSMKEDDQSNIDFED